MVVGFGLLSTIDHETNMVLLGVYLFVLGIGMGMTMQNLVLAVQNTVAATDLGAASSTVTFFRSLGGTIGVSVLGAVLTSRVGDLIHPGPGRHPGAAAARRARATSGWPTSDDAPAAIRTLIRVSYGDATGRIFLISAVVAVVALVADPASSGRSRCAPRAATERLQRGGTAERALTRRLRRRPASRARRGAAVVVVRCSALQGGVQGDVHPGQRLAHRAAHLGGLAAFANPAASRPSTSPRTVS